VAEHSPVRTVAGKPGEGWRVRYTCTACDWRSDAEALTPAAAVEAQAASVREHFERAANVAARGKAAGSPPPVSERPSRKGWLGLAVAAFVIFALVGECSGTGQGAGDKYTPEKCSALQLSAISGDAHSATEYHSHCH
jgi:hypothetical protein